MKVCLLSYAIVLLGTVVADGVTQKQVVVSYPGETPDSVVNQAKEAILAAGGVITHEYQLIKGFAATASASALEMVTTLSTEFYPTIEEDQIISVNDN